MRSNGPLASGKPLSKLTATDLCVLAIGFRAMVAADTDAKVSRALTRLAERYEAAADGRRIGPG